MSEPTTEAGRRLVNSQVWVGVSRDLAAEVLAIEAEARAQGALHAHLINEGDIEEIARLRRIEEAARRMEAAIGAVKPGDAALTDEYLAAYVALRAALEEK